MTTIKVDKITPGSGTTTTLGDSGDTFTIPAGVTFANSGSGVTPQPPSVGGEDFSETQGGNTVVYPQQKGYKQEISATYPPTVYGLYENYTQELDLRFRGRQVLFKISSSD